MDSIEKLQRPQLPPYAAFVSLLNQFSVNRFRQEWWEVHQSSCHCYNNVKKTKTREHDMKSHERDPKVCQKIVCNDIMQTCSSSGPIYAGHAHGTVKNKDI